MGNLTTTLFSAANALSVFSQTLNVIENNISNANTPGYARQDQLLVADAFDPSTGLAGGVSAGPVLNSRSEYLEQQVRTQQASLGSAQQTAGDLAQVQSLFDLTSTTGVSSALNNFFNAFSQLSVDPNDTVSRQAVISQASALAQSIQSTASGIEQVSTNATSQAQGVVSQINQIAAQIAQINQQYQANAESQSNEGLDAQMHSDLENLSSLTNFTMLRESDGAYDIAIGGQTPLVIGASTFNISLDSSSGQSAILDSQGNDITSQLTQGQLGALITEQNTTLPGYLTQLNTFAQSLADQVNGQLSEGVDENGNPGQPLFTYGGPTNAASTIAVNNITPDQIAAASVSAPGGNGNAVALTQLGTQQAINGFTFTQFYGNLGGQVGADVAAAQSDQQQAQNQLTQAESLRAQQSGVDLNTEATEVLQFQQAYQAAGKLVSILDNLTETVIDMVNPATS